VGQRVVSIRAASVYVADQLLGTVAVLRDVTKEVEVERMKSDFIANVTHELRTPLTSIVGYIDFMLMGGAGKLEEQPLRFLGTIKNNAERLRNLVEDLLSISELDSGRGKLNVEELDLEDLIMTVVGHLASVFGQQGKQFDVVTDVARDLSIQGDRVKVTQIISNIVENAFSYTYSGGKVTIMANMQPDQRHVLISIADTGIGIPEEFRSRIWNRFERYEEHALVMDVAGTGLGLPIVKTLVEMHGGEVWLESEVNRGTTFFVRLPLVPPPSVAGDGLAILAAAPTSTQTAPPPASGSREAAAERGGNGYTTEHAEAGTVEEG
jgi:signal transduction histidine kinase